MNFIIEFLPKHDSNLKVVVVRASNGFPLGVFDNLDDATKFVASEVEKVDKPKDDVKR